jgi:hypothetical protein
MKTFALIAVLLYNGTLQDLKVENLSWNQCASQIEQIRDAVPNATVFCMDNELSKQVVRVK